MSVCQQCYDNNWSSSNHGKLTCRTCGFVKRLHKVVLDEQQLFNSKKIVQTLANVSIQTVSHKLNQSFEVYVNWKSHLAGYERLLSAVSESFSQLLKRRRVKQDLNDIWRSLRLRWNDCCPFKMRLSLDKLQWLKILQASFSRFESAEIDYSAFLNLLSQIPSVYLFTSHWQLRFFLAVKQRYPSQETSRISALPRRQFKCAWQRFMRVCIKQEGLQVKESKREEKRQLGFPKELMISQSLLPTLCWSILRFFLSYQVFLEHFASFSEAAKTALKLPRIYCYQNRTPQLPTLNKQTDSLMSLLGVQTCHAEMFFLQLGFDKLQIRFIELLGKYLGVQKLDSREKAAALALIFFKWVLGMDQPYCLFQLANSNRLEDHSQLLQYVNQIKQNCKYDSISTFTDSLSASLLHYFNNTSDFLQKNRQKTIRGSIKNIRTQSTNNCQQLDGVFTNLNLRGKNPPKIIVRMKKQSQQQLHPEIVEQQRCLMFGRRMPLPCDNIEQPRKYSQNRLFYQFYQFETFLDMFEKMGLARSTVLRLFKKWALQSSKAFKKSLNSAKKTEITQDY